MNNYIGMSEVPRADPATKSKKASRKAGTANIASPAALVMAASKGLAQAQYVS